MSSLASVRITGAGDNEWGGVLPFFRVHSSREQLMTLPASELPPTTCRPPNVAIRCGSLFRSIVLRYQDDNPRYVLDTVHIQEGWAMFWRSGIRFLALILRVRREVRVVSLLREHSHPVRHFFHDLGVSVPVGLCARGGLLIRIVGGTPPTASPAGGVKLSVPPHRR